MAPARRILVVNPNSAPDCTATIAASIQHLTPATGPWFDVVTLAEGPPAIATWRDWHAVADPLCRLVEREASAAAIVIACVSDPAIDLLRSLTTRPVLGALRSAIATALARAERFGLVAFVDASIQRQARVLQAMGLEHRSVGSIPLNLPMATLGDPAAIRIPLHAIATRLKDRGAEAIILGCAGMASHRAWLEHEIGLPIIEPCQAAAAQALLATT